METDLSSRTYLDSDMFAPMAVQGSQFVVSFDRQADIRRRAYELEDVLKDVFGMASVLGVPENADPDVPRIIFGNPDTRYQFVISEISMHLVIGPSKDAQVTLESLEREVAEKVEIPFSLLSRMNAMPRIVGVSAVVRFPSVSQGNTFMRRIARYVVTTEPERYYYDLNVKRTTVEHKKYFSNITIANYRTFNLSNPRSGLLRLPLQDVSAQGIEITSDYNDRYAYNEAKAYQTSRATGDLIVRYGFAAMRKVIEELAEVGA